MLMSNLTPETEQLLVMCRSLLAAAEAMEWEKVERLERERMFLMEKFFSSVDPGKSDMEFLTSVVEEMRTIDRQVVSLIEAERNRTAQELRMLRHSRQREQAYRLAEND
jgi:hypothetical protein